MDTSPPSGTKSHRTLYVGLAVGIAIPILLLGRDLIARVRWSEQGGVGEGAIWGEDVFYMIALGVPLAILGATAGAIIDARRATRQPPRPSA